MSDIGFFVATVYPLRHQRDGRVIAKFVCLHSDAVISDMLEFPTIIEILQTVKTL
jgi:hypothetical protein